MTRPRAGAARQRSLATAPVLSAIVAAVAFIVALTPAASPAAGCDKWLNKTGPITGSYVAAAEPYARPFVFAMLVDCGGIKETVTVQRASGNLPVCEARHHVEVTGTLIWTKRLVDGHYEITDPSNVRCLSAPQPTSAPPAQREPLPPVRTTPLEGMTPPRAQAKAIGSSVWVGRYQDSRGTGDVTFTLVRGESIVAGTWKLRTGGGGPVMGLVEAGGSRMQLRLENVAPECPGTFEGAGEMTDTTLIASYRGKDCAGSVTDGRLELRLQ